ncbi:uncharacterized protein LOC142321926 [Lycorma delicatula]|uniref:uncharacterized protein LOC142321926 n=1 Tax=Lycorma delicatula TaxID=130591 RepID=UPI003F513972
MTTIRQSSSNTIHTTSASHLNNSHDDNLDMLLEDLQTSVSRPGSSLGMNGPITSGYREVSRTVTNQGMNGPETSREYHIEYLNPANTTTVLSERAASPNLDILADTSDLPPGSRKVAQYKVATYQYKTGGSPAHEASGGGDLRMRQNINELDSLLDDLHTAQRTGFSADNSSSLVKKSSGYDSSLIEPIETSTPKGGHVSRSVERKVYQEQRYGSVGRQSPARELKQEHLYSTSIKPEASPLRQRKEVYKYESKTTRSGNTREFSPPSPPPIRSSSGSSPSRQLQSVRTYNYTSSSDQDTPRTPTMHRSPSPTTHRSTSPAGRTVRSYNYSSNRTHEYATDGGSYSHPQPPYRSPSPTPKRTHTYNTVTTTTNTSHDSHRGPLRSPSPSPASKTTVHSYNYSTSTKETKSDVPKSPPPHRSPSPVSFISPPLSGTKTTVKTYSFEQSPRPQSPQPIQKFSPSDPSRTLNYQVSPPPNQTNVYSYKYTTHTSQSNKYPAEEHVPLLPRPFPTPSPTPDQQQQPPKKLDELMASFSDTEIHQQHHQHHETPNRYTHQPPPQQLSKQQQVVVAENPPPPAPPTTSAEQPKSKNVTGPPVYYPPGVELFSKKEEMFTQQQSGGGKMKAKAKYEYEASSKSKQKSSSGKAVVPVCLPVCCAMPCVIM